MTIHYSTANVGPRDRFEYWHDVVCTTFVAAQSKTECRRDFDAELIANDVGRIVISEMAAPAHVWRRELAQIRSDSEEYYLLSILRSGSGVLEQRGSTVQQGTGDIVLYDTAQPFSYALAARVNFLKIPRDYLDARAPHARRLLATNLSIQPQLAAMLSDVVASILEMPLTALTAASVVGRLSDTVLDLLLAILDLHAETHTRGYDTIERIRSFVLANLGSQEISPKTMAQAGAVSTRTLNRLFGQMGTTPMRWVQQERLRLSENYLRTGTARSVTEAALMVGFNDLGHFSRSFKQHHGCPPERLLLRLSD